LVRFSICNKSSRPVFVPARGGLSIVLAPGERSTVCPEGKDGQSAFWKLFTQGAIEETGKAAAAIRRLTQTPPAGMRPTAA
jgi:hypothetical protein